jgi:hypothetical protein
LVIFCCLGVLLLLVDFWIVLGHFHAVRGAVH